jgi:hypothetical protein
MSLEIKYKLIKLVMIQILSIEPIGCIIILKLLKIQDLIAKIDKVNSKWITKGKVLIALLDKWA